MLSTALGREEEVKEWREPIGADRRPPITPLILVAPDRRSAVPAAAAMNRRDE